MEQETVVKEILQALKVHSNQMEQRFNKIDKRFEKVDQRLDLIDERLDRMEKKMDGFRVELTETQETVDFIAKKTLQHEKKLREFHHQ
ncbi:hypothetical protein [Bacillus sp. FJAT-29937]|uniref:hypothetical protein n=1 Tax=Bacillus sp. FJAT-29937 TaxID=1720553 RepID=UPI0008336673|nr:hypothetical protein [Bacillus sp. FJAT-29937]